MGKARHRSRASPIMIQGGKAHGPRGPRTDFYMLPYITRLTGLIHCLSAKFAQGKGIKSRLLAESMNILPLLMPEQEFKIVFKPLISDDVRIVQDLNIPSDQPEYIVNLIEDRGWGISTLFVDKNDIFPRNLTAATETIFHACLLYTSPSPRDRG